MKTLEATNRPHSRRLGPIAVLALALGAPFGCGREFYREWANQDVSEAVFEKSRDPRSRLDMFSIAPPALSRFADPYDPDVPPAPPDDRAAEALSPVPQWPAHRLVTPVEGTGYLDMLETWQRQRPEPEKPPEPPPAQRRVVEPPTPPPDAPSPFQPAPNSGTSLNGMSPSTMKGPQPSNPNPTRPGAPPLHARAPKTDLGVRLAAFQETRLPVPVPPAEPASPQPRQPSRDLRFPTPPAGMDPFPIESDLSAPFVDPYRGPAAERMGEMAGLLGTKPPPFNEAEGAGLPRNSRPYVLTMEQAFTLALINSRFYQFQLEQIYIASLAVTLQRFAFTPQFFANLGPATGVPSVASPVVGALAPGFPVGGLANQFIYRTRETGNPFSSLTLSEVAGFGKAFSSGARIAGGFANQLLWNFLGQNSRQPTVNSFLPLTIVQPFLRGGGRAVTLEALTQAERTLLYQVRAFAKFRQDFIAAVLVGVAPQTAGNTDPVIGFIRVLQDVQSVENDLKNIASFENLVQVYKYLIEGEPSGLSQLQLDQVESSLYQARQNYVQDRTVYRNDLDNFKIQLGLPPDVPVVLDRSLTKAFQDVFNEIDDWSRDPKREMTYLPKIVDKLPDLEDVIIDGRSMLDVYNAGTNEEDTLEPLILAAQRVALEHRLDLMNQRATLYDTWRQIRVTANALRGVLNVTLTNQFLTPTTTTNPFAFLDSARQFSLVLNAELPLVRLPERNNFVQALINYQRQRRTLMEAEDDLKFQIRQDIRTLHQQYLIYGFTQRNLILTIRQKDQAFEQIIAPPAGATSGTQSNQGAIQTTNLVQFQQNLLNRENQLINTWQLYQQARVTLYRDLGIMPYDEWEAFNELFPSESSRGNITIPPGNGAGGRQGTGIAQPPRNPAPAPAQVGNP